MGNIADRLKTKKTEDNAGNGNGSGADAPQTPPPPAQQTQPEPHTPTPQQTPPPQKIDMKEMIKLFTYLKDTPVKEWPVPKTIEEGLAQRYRLQGMLTTSRQEVQTQKDRVVELEGDLTIEASKAATALQEQNRLQTELDAANRLIQQYEEVAEADLQAIVTVYKLLKSGLPFLTELLNSASTLEQRIPASELQKL
jgi:hypothetical protein